MPVSYINYTHHLATMLSLRSIQSLDIVSFSNVSSGNAPGRSPKTKARPKPKLVISSQTAKEKTEPINSSASH